MISKTAQLHADRAVRSIARDHKTHDNNAQTVWSIRSDTDWEARRRGYARNAEWLAYVEREAINAIEARIQSAAPNAANAAPLMPVCWRCNGTGTYESYAGYDGPCSICAGTGRLRATREGFPAIIRPGHLGADESLPALAWPGGYPLVYLPCDEYGDTSAAVILCATCATQSLHNPDEWSDEEAMTSVLEDGDLEQDVVCDGCGTIIAHQNYCYECGEGVDTEDAPHLCPKTEPYTVRYLTHCPGSDWIVHDDGVPTHGPNDAANVARCLRFQGIAAFVHVQPTRLPFPPVIEEEED